MAVAADAAVPAVRPSLDEARGLARDYNLIPLRHTFIADTETPVSAFLKLRGRHPETPGFLLESAEQGQRIGRYSFIGVRPRKIVRWSLGDDGDPYAIAEAEVKRYSQAPLADRQRERPDGSYTVKLLDDPPLIGEKVMEEAEEVARAAREETDDRVDEEAADVLYHLTVLLHSRGRALTDAEEVLNGRRG